MDIKIVLSTRNSSKLEQIRGVFEGSPISIISLDEAGIQGQADEAGDTLEANALAKAMFVHEKNKTLWAMADDTGIFIDALGEKPGVHTANWNGGNKETPGMMQWVLGQLKDITNRVATFKTVVAIVAPNGEQHFFKGEVRGTLLEKPRTEPQPGMPYSSIFQPDESSKTWAQMTVAEENAISHRGKAFRQAREFLENLKF